MYTTDHFQPTVIAAPPAEPKRPPLQRPLKYRLADLLLEVAGITEGEAAARLGVRLAEIKAAAEDAREIARLASER